MIQLDKPKLIRYWPDQWELFGSTVHLATHKKGQVYRCHCGMEISDEQLQSAKACFLPDGMNLAKNTECGKCCHHDRFWDIAIRKPHKIIDETNDNT